MIITDEILTTIAKKYKKDQNEIDFGTDLIYTNETNIPRNNLRWWCFGDSIGLCERSCYKNPIIIPYGGVFSKLSMIRQYILNVLTDKNTNIQLISNNTADKNKYYIYNGEIL